MIFVFLLPQSPYIYRKHSRVVQKEDSFVESATCFSVPTSSLIAAAANLASRSCSTLLAQLSQFTIFRKNSDWSSDILGFGPVSRRREVWSAAKVYELAPLDLTTWLWTDQGLVGSSLGEKSFPSVHTSFGWIWN
jgi:hypothetical protein